MSDTDDTMKPAEDVTGTSGAVSPASQPGDAAPPARRRVSRRAAIAIGIVRAVRRLRADVPVLVFMATQKEVAKPKTIPEPKSSRIAAAGEQGLAHQRRRAALPATP